MGSVVVSHVDEFLGLGCSLESGFAYCGRFAHEGYHCTVSRESGIHVEDLDTLDCGDSGHYAVDD